MFDKIFSIKNEYRNFRKYKAISFLFFKYNFSLKLPIPLIRDFYQNNKPKPLFEIENLTRKQVYLSIAAIYKNEPDIKEWIEYHKLVGVERFYLYDNESDDNSYEILKPYIEDGTVIYNYIKGSCMQMPVYRDAIYRYKNETKWLAIIDLDEYICPVEKDNLKDFLKDYENYPAVGVNWVMFDSNGYKKRPNKLILEAYTRVHKNYQILENKHIKSIVQPKEVKYISNPHFCFYKKQKTAVCENFQEIGKYNNYDNTINAFTNNNSIKKIRINHYFSKSKEDSINKIKRGFADSKRERKIENKDINFKETTEDYVIQKYLPELKKKMEIYNN